MAEVVEVATETPVIRTPGSTTLIDHLKGMKTVQQVFDYAVNKFADCPGFGRRKLAEDGKPFGDFEFITYKEFSVMVGNLGRGLDARFPGPKAGEAPRETRLVGIFAVNRVEWVATDMACANFGFVTVPLYDSLGPVATTHIARETELTTVVCSRDKTSRVLQIAADAPSIRLIVQMEDVAPDQFGPAGTGPVSVVSFSDILKLGALPPTAASSPLEGRTVVSPGDLHTVVYTSGTGGLAKGVMISNGSFVAGIGGTVAQIESLPFYERQESFLSFLPLAHVLERQVFVIALYYGAKLGYFSGHVSHLMSDLSVLRPTVFFGVPRLWNKIFAGFKVKLAMKPWLLRKIFQFSFGRKSSYLAANERSNPQFTSALDFAFSQLKAGLGGRVKLIITGSAPLSPEIHRFLQVCFACPVVQGYGLSEGYPVAVCDLKDAETNHCGPPMPHVEVKLVDVPELHYSVRDRPHPRGEIFIRGPHVFSGYFRHPELTEAAFAPGGWYRTGDIGELLDGDRLRIIGRCKEVIKLSQGEFVVIEELEGIYSLVPMVAQIFVYGDSSRDFLVAVVVPDVDRLTSWWKAGHSAEAVPTMADMCRDPATSEMILRDLADQHAQSKLNGINRIVAVHVESELFSTDNTLLTPTSKLARENAKKRYAEIITGLYSKNQAATPTPGAAPSASQK